MNQLNKKLAPIGSERAQRLAAIQTRNPDMLLLQQQLYQQQQRRLNRLSDEDIAWLRSERELQFEWEHQQRFEKYWKLREDEREETQRFRSRIPGVTHSYRMPHQHLDMAPRAVQALPFGIYMDSPQILLHPGHVHGYYWNLWHPPSYIHYVNYADHDNINFIHFDENPGDFDNPGVYFPYFH